MIKVTVDLPDALKAALERRAKLEGRTQSAVAREALRAALAPYLASSSTAAKVVTRELGDHRH